MNCVNYSLLLVAICFCNVIVGERLHEQIYSTIEGGAACFRRLNGTHQAGCSSSDAGAVGVVHMIESLSDVEWVVFNGTAGPYVAVISTALFYDTVELFMEHPDNVAGILIYDSVKIRSKSFTQESRCPNEYYSGPNSQCSSDGGGVVWNEKGTALLRRNIPFPVFYLPQSRAEEIDKIQNCYERFNLNKDNQKGRPLCSLQLNSFMFAAMNTEVCLRRSASSSFLTSAKVCDPLGDNNVYYTLFPRGKETEGNKKNVTLVTARIDTASLFDGVSPGAASSVVGLVTLITAASLLAKMIPPADAGLYKHNIMWTLFNGEAFDYIGSQRVAYDISRGQWPPAAPLNANQIQLHVEIGQLGGALLANQGDASWPLQAFAPYTSLPPSEITEFLALASDQLTKANMSLTPTFSTNLPPSSLHSFRRILKNETESGALPELVLVDHGEVFSNNFYHSVLDDEANVAFSYRNISVDSNGTFLTTEELLAAGTMSAADMQVKLARLATALASTLHQRVAGAAYAGNLTASAHLVDEMLHCFLQSQACRLFSAAEYGGARDPPPARPAPLYVGVSSWPTAPPVLAAHLLALLAGTTKEANKTECNGLSSDEYSYYWLRGWNNTGVCVETTMNYTQAVSPAFIIKGYDYKSGIYSTWTESVWQAMWVRLFVAAGGGGARAAAAAGGVATALAAAVTFWLQRHADRIFLRSQVAAVAGGSGDAASGILRSVNC
ncbi:hypothetical protein JYU34_011346 [Plutella xylostella]|uniref:Nicastrin n=1 Tax=Plutella xylostella TaxID=51655 RepID=A0ABQ7QGQ3_PLUXY|nr:hypothetical protein JYU34_011346 [Plutella xylostella]